MAEITFGDIYPPRIPSPSAKKVVHGSDVKNGSNIVYIEPVWLLPPIDKTLTKPKNEIWNFIGKFGHTFFIEGILV